MIPSKQRPRKITMQGEDGRDYVFLLKGHEDLRQDERVMQLFGQVCRSMAYTCTSVQEVTSVVPRFKSQTCTTGRPGNIIVTHADGILKIKAAVFMANRLLQRTRLLLQSRILSVPFPK